MIWSGELALFHCIPCRSLQQGLVASKPHCIICSVCLISRPETGGCQLEPNRRGDACLHFDPHFQLNPIPCPFKAAVAASWPSDPPELSHSRFAAAFGLLACADTRSQPSSHRLPTQPSNKGQGTSQAHRLPAHRLPHSPRNKK